MIIGMIKYHLLLLAREPLNLFFGFGLPFLQLLVFSNAFVDGDENRIEVATPLIILIGVMVLCFTDSAWSHAHSRQTKFLRRMMMTPVKSFHYILTGILSRIGVLLIFATSFIAVAAIVFDLSLADRNWGLFAFVLLLAFIMFYLIGMFIANVLKNAKSSPGLVLAMFFVMLTFSGAWFPIADLPSVLQIFARSLPPAYAVTSLQAVWVGTDLFAGHYFIAMLVAIVIFGVLTTKFFKYE